MNRHEVHINSGKFPGFPTPARTLNPPITPFNTNFHTFISFHIMGRVHVYPIKINIIQQRIDYNRRSCLFFPQPQYEPYFPNQTRFIESSGIHTISVI